MNLVGEQTKDGTITFVYPRILQRFLPISTDHASAPSGLYGSCHGFCRGSCRFLYIGSCHGSCQPLQIMPRIPLVSMNPATDPTGNYDGSWDGSCWSPQIPSRILLDSIDLVGLAWVHADNCSAACFPLSTQNWTACTATLKVVLFNIFLNKFLKPDRHSMSFSCDGGCLYCHSCMTLDYHDFVVRAACCDPIECRYDGVYTTCHDIFRSRLTL